MLYGCPASAATAARSRTSSTCSRRAKRPHAARNLERRFHTAVFFLIQFSQVANLSLTHDRNRRVFAWCFRTFLHDSPLDHRPKGATTDLIEYGTLIGLRFGCHRTRRLVHLVECSLLLLERSNGVNERPPRRTFHFTPLSFLYSCQGVRMKNPRIPKKALTCSTQVNGPIKNGSRQ